MPVKFKFAPFSNVELSLSEEQERSCRISQICSFSPIELNLPLPPPQHTPTLGHLQMQVFIIIHNQSLGDLG